MHYNCTITVTMLYDSVKFIEVLLLPANRIGLSASVTCLVVQLGARCQLSAFSL